MNKFTHLSFVSRRKIKQREAKAAQVRAERAASSSARTLAAEKGSTSAATTSPAHHQSPAAPSTSESGSDVDEVTEKLKELMAQLKKK